MGVIVSILLHCRSDTRRQCKNDTADLRDCREVLTVAQKCLFALVWPDTFRCRSQRWWVRSCRSTKEPSRWVSKSQCSWLSRRTLSALIRSVTLTRLMMYISFSEATWPVFSIAFWPLAQRATRRLHTCLVRSVFCNMISRIKRLALICDDVYVI